MTDQLSKLNNLIVEQLAELLESAAKVLPPVEFAILVVSDKLSDRHLQAILAAATQKLKERELTQE